MEVGAVEDVAQHVLAALGHLVGDDVSREVDFGLGLMVVLLVEPLQERKRATMELGRVHVVL